MSFATRTKRPFPGAAAPFGKRKKKLDLASTLKADVGRDSLTGRFKAMIDENKDDPSDATEDGTNVMGKAKPYNPLTRDKGNVDAARGIVSSEHGGKQEMEGHSPRTQDAAASVKTPDFIFSNTLRRGARVTLKSGVEARIMDNKQGDTRLATIYGARKTEVGQININDATHVLFNGKNVPVKQPSLRSRGYGFG